MPVEVVSTSPHVALKTALVALFTDGLTATGLTNADALIPSEDWDAAPLDGITVGDDEFFTEYPTNCLVIESDGQGVEYQNGIGIYDVMLEITLITAQDLDRDQVQQLSDNVHSILSQRLHEDEPDATEFSILAWRVNAVCAEESLPCEVWDVTPGTAIRVTSAKDEEGRDQRIWNFSLRASTKTSLTPP
jgi:hypothetical protein